jgi:hypothetical protein
VASFLRNLLNKLAPLRGPAKRDLFLTAFGKHPGWDDHLEIGMDTERLTVVKRLLYVDGIGGNIESGAWDRLKENQRLAGFDHVFVWRSENDVVVGRLWSSKDGKGRGRYPMVVCAQSGMPLAWVVGTILPGLERIQRACMETTSAAAVSDVLNEARRSLRSDSSAARSFYGRPEGQKPELPGGYQEEHAADNGGLPTILYHLERELGAGPLPLSPDMPKVTAVRTAHLRVPALSELAAGGAVQWIDFLLNFVTDETPILALCPNGGSWIDLIVGEPSAAHLYCILASPAAIPLTTDIPYHVEEEFLLRAKAFVASQPRAGKSRQPVAGTVRP